MGKQHFLWVLALALVCAQGTIGANPDASGIVIGELEAYPTFECIGLRLAYEGDSDSNAVIDVRYREKGGDWREAHPLGRIKGNRFAGSIFFLRPGTAYQVEVTASDPGAARKETKAVDISTRSDRIPTGGGKEYYVAPEGKDSNKGTAGTPLKTIRKAAELAGPGDIVRIQPGLYREAVALTRSGRAGAYIPFVADGKGAVISGADPRYDTLEGRGLWQDEGDGVYSTDPGFQTLYVGFDGTRLYHYVTMDGFREFICGEPGGWFQDKAANRLYVRLSSGDNPGDHMVQVAALDFGFRISGASYILLDGLEIRDCGRGEGGYGVHLDNASWCVIRNCSIHGMQTPVALSGAKSEGNLIESCELWDTSIPRWPWAMTKAHDEEGGAVGSAGGRGNVVRGCRIHGLMNGVAPSNWGQLEDESFNCDWDVYENEIYDMRDDAIEPEGPSINSRFWNNWCCDTHNGVSLAPITVGPTYVMYNAIFNFNSTSIKYAGIGPGLCYIYHNSAYAKTPATSAIHTGPGTFLYHNAFYGDLPVTDAAFAGRGALRAQVYRNNVFYGTGWALESGYAPRPGNDIDYDAWYTSDTRWFQTYTGTLNKQFVRLGDKFYYSLKEFREGTGWEKHGFYLDPRFVGQETGDLRLRPDSPCVDRGVPLPNINDGYVGRAPDMGAYERGSEVHGPFPLGRRLR